MNRVWTGNHPAYRNEYECNKCHRICYATKDGYLPIHRAKGKRTRCDGSNSAVAFHRKIG